MANVETADQIFRTRMVSASALLEGRADLSRYPFRLLAIHSPRGSTGNERMSFLLTAAEHLMSFGWDAVNITDTGQGGAPIAVMQRRLPE
jgi:hypothetical protein